MVARAVAHGFCVVSALLSAPATVLPNHRLQLPGSTICNRQAGAGRAIATDAIVAGRSARSLSVRMALRSLSPPENARRPERPACYSRRSDLSVRHSVRHRGSRPPAAYRQMQQILEVGPVDELAQAIANLIIGIQCSTNTGSRNGERCRWRPCEHPATACWICDDITDLFGESCAGRLSSTEPLTCRSRWTRRRPYCAALAGCTGVTRVRRAPRVQR